ncbi:RNA polymerase sigma factor [Sinomicrobium weinanense]|uniref:Sigma-70 family RNA polymerase sigma factor n=1 Tax=Sinomicrobium weinanense TaxID=2842200 RepID=A0A926Q3A9_9FLAO|nr:sigma-70 family RNA polymerase sigma factor [Sinomicrobium weinanense]MBC9797422.1 sigma-70 family RNA polymerase sigma factor [Sinomicrobium weinanense]MBU3123084.1 sigma-70 family RNA polymerase sigma factor [Sinomicrobium weinanense]
MSILRLSYRKEKDSRIWSDMKRGSKEAFDRVFNEHMAYLLNYGRSFTGDLDLLEDCAQELFCRIWVRRDTLKDTDNIRFYLMAAFRKELFKALKKEQKKNFWRSWILPSSLPGFEVSLETAMVEEETRLRDLNRLKGGFAQLSPRQKEIIYLKYYNQLSFDEISEVMQLDKKAVYNALSKAMLSLRKNISSTSS